MFLAGSRCDDCRYMLTAISPSGLALVSNVLKLSDVMAEAALLK
jgi:hypothetical protein